MAICLCHLMVTHLRAQPDVMVTCSDACESGAGVAASAGLSAYGVRSVFALPSELPQEVSNGLALISLFWRELRRAVEPLTFWASLL